MGLYHNRIVVKVGTSTLTNEIGQNNLKAFDCIARVLSDIQNMGYGVILVSSGAIAVGINKLQTKSRPTSMRIKPAAAVGQCSIMYLYDKLFSDYDKTVAQILLNAEDMENEEKKGNLINTSNTLLEMGIIPIVNENDSVSYTDIQSEDKLFGDNDTLSAGVSVLCRAKSLVIFSDIDGFYDSDPRLHPDAKLIDRRKIEPDSKHPIYIKTVLGTYGHLYPNSKHEIIRIYESPIIFDTIAPNQGGIAYE